MVAEILPVSASPSSFSSTISVAYTRPSSPHELYSSPLPPPSGRNSPVTGTNAPYEGEGLNSSSLSCRACRRADVGAALMGGNSVLFPLVSVVPDMVATRTLGVWGTESVWNSNYKLRTTAVLHVTCSAEQRRFGSSAYADVFHTLTYPTHAIHDWFGRYLCAPCGRRRWMQDGNDLVRGGDTCIPTLRCCHALWVTDSLSCLSCFILR